MYMSWWSQVYNRPLKDPVLLSYTLEELIYEYNENQARSEHTITSIDQEGDKIEDDKQQADMDWADMMEEEDRKLEEKKVALKKKKAEQLKQEQEDLDPREDPSNLEWMEEEMKKAKEKHGPEFGDDITVSFDD